MSIFDFIEGYEDEDTVTLNDKPKSYPVDNNIDIPPDLAARRILMAAYMYYNCNESSRLSDTEYDQLSGYVADNWDQLDPVRKWQCGTPEETRATGCHFKFTAYCISAARQDMFDRGIQNVPLPDDSMFAYDKAIKLRYINARG